MELTRGEVADLITAFLAGSGGRWDWDDFISVPMKDIKLERVRLAAASMPERFPPSEPGWYCNDEGLKQLRQLAEALREST